MLLSVLAGGHCASNPEPMADFIDAFVIGDGEEAVVDVVHACSRHKGDRGRVLEALARIPGVYVPFIHGAQTPKPQVKANIIGVNPHIIVYTVIKVCGNFSLQFKFRFCSYKIKL